MARLKNFSNCVVDAINGMNIGAFEKQRKLNEWMSHSSYKKCMSNEQVHEIADRPRLVNLISDWDLSRNGSLRTLGGRHALGCIYIFNVGSGDHTEKIIDCQTGKCLKVLSGHRRTPWAEVVRAVRCRERSVADVADFGGCRLGYAEGTGCKFQRAKEVVPRGKGYYKCINSRA